MDCIGIGKRIKQARETASMTQERLSSLLSCTPQHVSALERGVKQPSLETLVSIAIVLNVSSDFLLQDVLKVPASLVSDEIAMILERLSPHDQLRCLCALRAFSEYSDKV